MITLLLPISLFAQNKMRPVEELINKIEPGWTHVQQWIDSAKNKVEILSSDPLKAKDALYKTQVTTRSPMGAIIYSTGGLLIDHGWIRILGSGHEKLNRTLPDWNKGKSFKEFGDIPRFLLVADDAIGGFFALNAGQFGSDMGKIYYLSPDNLGWEPLDLSYSEFLTFCFNGHLSDFYKGLRWTNWKEEVSKLDGNKVYNFYPPLWSKEGKDFNKNSHEVIPVEEQYDFNIYTRKQMGFENPEHNNNLRISPLTGDFYIFTTYNLYKGEKIPANGMYMVTDHGVVMIDSPWDTTQFQPLLDSIKAKHNKNVVMCFATHFHEDRTGGFDYYRQLGIKTYSTRRTDELSKKRGMKRAEFLMDKDTVFTVGQYSFQIYYPGHGHAPDNIVVWFEKEKILYGGV